MTLYDLGFTSDLEDYVKNYYPNQKIGRISAEHKERYTVLTEEMKISAEISGQFRYNAESPGDFPAVGDFVVMTLYDNFSMINAILPRRTLLERQKAGRTTDHQIIAANIDIAFIVQSVDRDFNLNRIDRYRSICHASNIKAIILLSKVDTIDIERKKDLIRQLKSRFPELDIHAFHNLNQNGFSEISSLIKAGTTFCFIGSSGVGKSTLINNLIGEEHFVTKEINSEIGRGRHTTTHRELILLQNGGILIDTPGMREIGLTDISGTINELFSDIVELSESCQYSNCSHRNDDGCAILKALASGELDTDRWKQYQKMQRETEHFTLSIAEKRKKDKELGSLYKRMQNAKRRFR